METLQAVIGGHAYQPDRSFSIVEEIPTSPDNIDWSFKAVQRVYGPLGELGLYDQLSYDFAPPLGRELRRIQRQNPGTDTKAIAELMKNGCHINGIATTAVHAILPHLSTQDKQLLVRAGIGDYVRLTGSKPTTFWLPEGALDNDSLSVLVNNGIKAFICAPEQIGSERPSLITLGAEKNILALPFNSRVSREIAFDHEQRTNAEHFTSRVISPLLQAKRDSNDPSPLIIFSDLETYGMYDIQKESNPSAPGSEFFLNYLIKHSLPDLDVEITSINSIVENLYEHIDCLSEATIRENSAWSCSDGLARWDGERDCPESGGAIWKAPFYRMHSRLNQTVDRVIRNNVGEDAIREIASDTFDETILAKPSAQKVAALGAKILALVSRASCGTFFDSPDVSGRQNCTAALGAVRLLNLAGLNKEANYCWNEYTRELDSVCEALTSSSPLKSNGFVAFAETLKSMAME